MGRVCYAEYPPEKEYVGHMYNDWEIISADILYSKDGKAFFLCRCHCEICSSAGAIPEEKYVRHYYLYTGKSKRCKRGAGLVSHPKTSENRYDLSGEYGLCYMDHDEKPFVFDKEDYDLIKDYVWKRRSNGGYIYSLIRSRVDGHNKVSTIALHRLIMGISDQKFSDTQVTVDHINHDVSDNRRSNLRIATTFENCLNKQMSSPYYGRGIYRNNHGKWVVKFRRNQKYINGGSFDNYIDALQRRFELEPELTSPFQYTTQTNTGVDHLGIQK